jgi:ABC-type nitrate/sulfonate/bicarbonate transport system ATPase subunit
VTAQIVIDGVSHVYRPPRGKPVLALEDVSLSVSNREFIALLGLSGCDTYRDANMVPNLDALQRNIDVTRELGLTKKKIDVKQHADLSLVQEAAQRLK